MKRIAPIATVVLAATWALVITSKTCTPAPVSRGLSSTGGGTLSSGGGLSKVTTTGTLLTGSGTSGNPLGISIGVGSGLAGTGSSGSPLTVGAGSGILAAGAVTAVNLGAGLTFSSGAVVPNLTGGTCATGKMVTAVSSAGVATCANVDFNDYADTHLSWNDEWTQSGAYSNNSLGISPNGWICGSTGTGAACASATGLQTGTRPGILDMTTGTTNTGHAELFRALMTDFGAGNWRFDWTGGFSATSDASGGANDTYAAIIGFGDVHTLPPNQVDGCFFLYDRTVVTTAPGTGTITSNSNNLQCWCSSNSVRTGYTMDGAIVSQGSFTTVAAPVAALTLPNTNIMTLSIRMTAATKAEFYYNGVKSCEITTNIPSTDTRITGPYMQISKNASGSGVNAARRMPVFSSPAAMSKNKISL